jgi:hypothetical protein
MLNPRNKTVPMIAMKCSLFLVAVSLAVPAWPAGASAMAKRPNILLAISDDQSYPHASILGDPVVKTPAFDRVAREGVLFTHSFAACPSCTPSRSAILTGRQIWQVGEAGVLFGLQYEPVRGGANRGPCARQARGEPRCERMSRLSLAGSLPDWRLAGENRNLICNRRHTFFQVNGGGRQASQP